jgi:hypothetical protein
VLLVLAAVVGLIVSAAAWGFLELVHAIQIGVFEDLPGDLGYETAPIWWPLPWVALAGLLTAFAIGRLPGLLLFTVAAGLAVGGLAIAYAEATDEPTTAVLFSGQDAFSTLFGSAAVVPLSILALLLLFKGLAWSISLGNFRGGPTFPALFLGVVAAFWPHTCPVMERHRALPC